MKRALLAAALVAALIFGAGAVHAASFTYHGTLQDSGKPAEGNYDIELTLYSAASGGSVIGGPLVMYKVPVHGANFSTQTDFGPLTKSFTQAYIAVRVRAAGNGPFAALDARSPMAVGATASVCPGAWTLGGNASNPAGSYLGTADSNPLTFEVNATQAGQITPSGNGTTSTPNVVFGYSGNSALSSGGATIAGGGDSVFGGNRVQGAFAAVGGGTKNTASGLWSAVAGGLANTAGGYASTVSGGQESNASGSSAMIPGGYSNAAGGDFSFAAGNNAVVRNASNTPDCSSGLNCGDYGTFVWADTSTFNPFTSTGPNQFLIQATGGVGINTSALIVPGGAPAMTVQGLSSTRGTLDLAPDPSKGTNESNIHYGTTGDWYIRSATGMAASGPNGKVVLQDTGGGVGIGTATVNAGQLISTGANGANLTTGGVWTSTSGRTFKEAFADVDVGSVLARVLALPVQTWFYKVDHAEGRHMGPMAEDFFKSFGLGADDQHVGSIDESGVAYAAIQGLNAKLDDADKSATQKIDALEHENADLRGTLKELSTRLAKLESVKGQ